MESGRSGSCKARFLLRRGATVSASVLFGLAPTLCLRAQGLPASVAACAEETDVLKRLSCFDREVARYRPQPRAALGPSGAPPQAPAIAPPAAPPAAAPAAAQAAAAPAAVTAVAPVGAVASPPGKSVDPAASGARITAIDTYPDGVVLHLDNGQVWQEDEDTPVDLGLRVGDTVTLERVVGAYWVTGRHGATAKVRLKSGSM